MENAPQPKSRGNKKKWLVGLIGCGCLTAIVVGAVLIGLGGGLFWFASALPKTKIENFQITGEPRMINGALDYGAAVSFDVTNISEEPQKIQLHTEVECSEGKWSQDQKVDLAAKESRHLSMFFPQPTIEAKDCKGSVQVVR